MRSTYRTRSGCGYNLFGIDSDRCPECGLLIDRTATGESRIPWTHRKRIGRFRAFFRTAALATFHPNILAEEMHRPVSYADAQKFRHVCILIAWLPTVALLAVALCFLVFVLPVFWFAVFVFLAILLALVFWLYLYAITGLPIVFSAPRGLFGIVPPNRAVALSYYAAAPLIAVPVPTILGIVVILLAKLSTRRNRHDLLWLIILPVYIVPVIACFYRNLTAARLLKRTTGCSTARWWATVATLTVGDLVLLVLFLFISLMLESAFLPPPM